VGNGFTARGSSTGPDRLYLSNGGTDTILDVLTLAGCALAETPWQQNLVLRFADGQRHDRGFSGFDLGEVPWTPDWPAEKAFFLAVIDTAIGRHGWDRLRYDPPYVAGYLGAYREMLIGFTPVPVEGPGWGDWRKAPPPEQLTLCPTHFLYQGEFGCRLCDTWLQPID
jgi:hypothetical protein